MGFLADKKILITGLLSDRSIAYGIAQACRREGATLAFTYVNDDLKQRVTRLAAEFGSVPVLRCDVASDEQIGARQRRPDEAAASRGHANDVLTHSERDVLLRTRILGEVAHGAPSARHSPGPTVRSSPRWCLYKLTPAYR